MRRYRPAIILAIVLLALGGLASWDDWQTKKDEEAKKSENKLTQIKASDVVELRFESKGGISADPVGGSDEPSSPTSEPVQAVAVKQDGVWRLTAPVAVPADEGSISTLLTTVLDYSYAKVVSENKASWGDFGLTDPQRTIGMKTGGEAPAELTVYIGAKAPVGYNVYFRTNQDDRVFIGSQHLLASTTKSLFELRDKSIAKIDGKAVTSLTYEAAGEPAIEINKSGETWTIEKPQVLAADAPEVRDFIEELARIKALGFIDSPTPALVAAFNAPKARISWRDDKPIATSLMLAEHEGKLLASFVPAERVFELGEEYKGKLTKSLTSFRIRKIFAAGETDAKALTIDGDRYERVGGDWYKPEDAAKFDAEGKFSGDPKDKPAEVAHLRAFIVDLEFAKTDDFLPLDGVLAAKLTSPLHRITIAPKQGNEIVVDVYSDAERDDRFLVRRTGGTHLYRLPKAAFNSMSPQPIINEEMPEPEDGAPALEDEGLNLDEDAPDEEPAG